jgi:ParB family chromosome partitioning protein
MATKPRLNLAGFTGVVVAASKTVPDTEIEIALIDIERQVRTKIGDLTELVASIKAIGVLEPVILLLKADGRYRLIAGERRVRASTLAELVKIPVMIKRDLTETQIRQIQVTENNEREDLSPYDEAMGVADDVENFGFKEALVIWNRSEAWVSKRTAVKKYSAPVLEVLSTGLCGDLEVLHSLNQLHAINEREYDGLVERLRTGVTVSRDDVRNKVSTAKMWIKNAETLAKEHNEPGLAFPEQTESSATDVQSGPQDGTEEPVPVAQAKAKPKSKKPAPEVKKSAVKQGALPSFELTAQQEAVAMRKEAQTKLNRLRAEVMEWGDNNRAQFNSIQNNMAKLGFDMTESEWVLWSAFRDMVLPMLASLGPDRPAAYLRKLQADLKGKDALAAWRELHPTQLSESKTDDNANRTVVPSMPKGWTF